MTQPTLSSTARMNLEPQSVKSTITKFESYLLGKYNNWKQAQSYPTIFSQVCILWEKIDGGYHSCQWYRRDPRNPYREKYHKIEVIDENTVIVKNYHLDWTRHEDCDMIFTFFNNQWDGKLLGDKCIVRGNARVVSEVHLTKVGLESRDKGVDEDGNKVFGGWDLYKFVREGE